jgi:aconitate hydratase
VQSLGLNGSEVYSVTGLSESLKPGQKVTLEIKRASGEAQRVPVKLRIDTPIEIDYYRHGGILPFVLRELLRRSRA